MQKLLIRRDANGLPSDIINFSTDVVGGALAANVAQTIAIPAGANIVIFSIAGDFYCSNHDSATAVVPSGASGTVNVIRSPAARSLQGRTSLSIISPDAKAFCLAFYA